MFDASGDNRVRCLWRDPKTQKWTPHGYFPPSVTDEDILREFGGGEYWLQLLVQTQGGKEEIKQWRRMKLPGVHRIPNELPGIHRDIPGASTASSQNGKMVIGEIDGMSPGAALNTALVATVVDLLKSFKDQPKQPPPQPINWSELVSGAVQLATLFKREQPDMSPLEMLKAVKELIPQPNSAVPGGAANTVSDMVKGMKELMGLKDIVEGREAPPDPETAMWGAGMKALEVVGDYLTGKKGGDSTAMPQKEQAALPLGTPRWKVLLLAQKKQLLQAASFGVSAETAVELALTYLPQQMRGVLAEFLSMPDHVNVAMQTIPELNEFKQWTEEFFKELHAEFMGEEVDEDAEEGSERQAGNER